MSGKGELSSRVMNMKFMKFMRPEGQDNKDEGTSKHTHLDASKWDLKSSVNSDSTNKRRVVVKRASKALKIMENVGITSVKTEDDSNKSSALHGRRIFGENKNKRVAEEEEENKTEQEPKQEKDMDELFKESRRNTKPKKKSHKKHKKA
ncbi:uncharacterized protein HLK63_M10637 [Nakaseomyces glabratus]|nr:uncharacterized protein GW608_M10637 [Nakaseomyces glabratus]UCS29040.1 uncharacterized protein HLK63_M10637 [Nakaseomyces glabratus]UCS34269.1 uncharacterized protein HLK64_M10637 [Nakaseomyces glabratus]UCS39500.1 uncharacterized protein HLK62_M10637 [Nakaseomyces glabratus]